MHGDDAENDTQRLTRDYRTAGEEKMQPEWKTEHPLAHLLMGKYLIYQQGRTLSHATCTPTRAESTVLTTETRPGVPRGSSRIVPAEKRAQDGLNNRKDLVIVSIDTAIFHKNTAVHALSDRIVMCGENQRGLISMAIIN